MAKTTLAQLRATSKDFKAVMVFSSIEVTPELAGELLHLNGNNRPLKNFLVQSYTDQMKRGAWIFSGGSLSLTATGKLIDGQHRLESVIRSGTTQVFNIQTGLAEEAFETLDIGRMRNAGDTVAIMGFKSANNVAILIKMLIQHDAKNFKGWLAGVYKVSNNAEIRRWLKKNADKRDFIIESMTLANMYYKRVPAISPSYYAYFIYTIGQSKRQLIEKFFEMITGKANAYAHPSAGVIRRKFINMAISGNKRSRITTMYKVAIMIKAWNAFLKGYKLPGLDWNENEGFPSIMYS